MIWVGNLAPNQFKTLLSKVQTFGDKRLRQISGIFWPDHVIKHEELWKRTEKKR